MDVCPKNRLRELYNEKFSGLAWKKIKPHFSVAFERAGLKCPSESTIKRDHDQKSDSFLTTVPYDRWAVYISQVYNLDIEREMKGTGYIEKEFTAKRQLEESGKIFIKKELSNVEAKPQKRKSKIFKKRYLVATLMIVALLIIYFEVFGGYDISYATIEGFRIHSFDENGKQLWTTVLPDDAIQYTENFSTKKTNILVSSTDLMGCGRKKVVIYYTAINEKYHTPKLACYSNRGKILWTATVGPFEKIQTAVYEFNPVFSPSSLKIIDLDEDKRCEIFVTANHRPYFPSIAALYNCEGKELGRYISAGHFGAFDFKDLNGDNVKEIILGGANNEYNQASLVVLDPFNMNGKSPQTLGTNMDFIDFKEGTQLAYLRFPKLPMRGVIRSVITEIQNYPGGLKIGIKNNLETLDAKYPLSCTVTLTNTLELENYTIFDNVSAYWHNRYLDGSCNIDYNDKSRKMLENITFWKEGKWMALKKGTPVI